MSQPARVSDFEEDVVAKREATAPTVRLVTPVERVPVCCICSRKGFTRPVQVNDDGGLTGLCQTHNAFEREYRSALKQAAMSGAMTSERAKSVRADVVARFTTRRR